MRPHTQDANRFLFSKNFVNQAVLNIDASRVSACQITDQFLERRWILKWVVRKNRKQFQSLGFQATGGKLLRVLNGMLGKDKPCNLTVLPSAVCMAISRAIGVVVGDLG